MPCRTCATAIPSPSIWPFLGAVGSSIWLVWSIWSVQGFVWGLDPGDDRLHRLVLAAQGRDREEQLRGEAAVTTRREATPASVPAVRRGDALDVSGSPATASATAASCGGGTAAFMAIEGSAFAFMVAVYFYLRTSPRAGPIGAPAPSSSGARERGAHPAERVPQLVARPQGRSTTTCARCASGLAIICVFGTLLLAVRAMEFTRLNVYPPTAPMARSSG
jgi:cytochrome c oxidase subunit 1/cytochrome c oxidase subunit I+III